MVHPRWWVEGHTPASVDWQPSYEPIVAMIAPPSERSMEQRLDDLLASRQRLQGEQQRNLDTLLIDMFEQADEFAENQLEQESRPLTLPLARAHRIKPIKTKN